MLKMTEEQKYLFDLQGFIVLKNIIPQKTVKEVNEEMTRLSNMNETELPVGVCHGKQRKTDELYLSNIVEAGPIFHQFIDQEDCIPIISEVSLGLFRLNHVYAIYRWGGGYTYMHCQNRPMHPKMAYHCQNGEIFSLCTKAVFPMLNHRPEDGCFAAIPGSHKANFIRPFGDHPQDNPPLVPVLADPGDAIVFTEALTHGSLVNHSGLPRRTLYYCYSVGYMPDWSKFGLKFTDAFYGTLTPKQREIVRRKDD
jgi:hypothetical protein